MAITENNGTIIGLGQYSNSTASSNETLLYYQHLQYNLSNVTLPNSTKLVNSTSLSNSTKLVNSTSLSNSTKLVNSTSLSNSNVRALGQAFNKTLSDQLNIADGVRASHLPVLPPNLLANSQRDGNATMSIQVSKATKSTEYSHLQQNVPTTNDLSSLTLSAWVKPDYSQGSPQFTVLSKERSFILAINSNYPPQKKAVFSVFDGIKWNTITSNSTIPEDWTYLAATFNGKSISLYVNGKQESSTQLAGVLTIAVNGTLVIKTVNNLTSNAEVVEGATVNSIRDETSNMFSGIIQDPKLFDNQLTTYQISRLYSSEKPSFYNSTDLGN